MAIRLTRPLKRTILSFCTAATFVLTAQIQASSQVEPRPIEHSAPLTLTQARPTLSVQAVAAIGMTVSDMDQAIAFYTRVLPFRKLSDVEVWGEAYEHLEGVFGVRMRVVQLQLGNEVLELTDYLTPEGKPIPSDSRSNDRWFQHLAIVVSDMDQAYQHLRQNKVQYVSTAPQRLPDYLPAAAGIEAFYFRDPDGHNLELIHFPPGKGDPKWQAPTNQLFLGIDHTAIAVSNTPDSLAFYRDALGLRLAGESENYGPEQEHLNNVFGAHLRISGLRAPAGPGIEFLDYLAPHDGRLLPPDTHTNDLVQWQTTLVVQNADAAAQRLQSIGYELISSRVVQMPDASLGFSKGFLVRDPDGHIMRIVQK